MGAGSEASRAGVLPRRMLVALAMQGCKSLAAEASDGDVPSWPEQYTSVWNQFITYDDADVPPYSSGQPAKYESYQGSTFYDWPKQRMIQFMDSRSFAGLGCRYGNGQCKMLNLNSGPEGSGFEGQPVAYTWMTTGPHTNECCIERTVSVLPPNFVRPLQRQEDFNMTTYDENYEPVSEPVEWYSTPEVPHGFFVGFFKNKFVKTADGRDTKNKLTAMHGGHQFFHLQGWRWETYESFVLGPPPEDAFRFPASCLTARMCDTQPLPPTAPTEAPVDLVSTRDMKRARTKTPDDAYRGHGHRHMSEVLNAWMRKLPSTKACDQWSVSELRALVGELHGRRHPEFQSIYSRTSDPRRLRWEPEERWAHVDESLTAANERVHRDGLCHHAVMLFVHHLSEAERARFAGEMSLPLLSLEPHERPAAPVPAEERVHKAYKEDVRCVQCHWNPNQEPTPYPPLNGSSVVV